MNLNEFYKIHTISGDKYLGDDYCGVLFDYYETGGLVFKYDINLSIEQFSKLFEIVHDSLKIKLSEDEIKKAFIQYIQILMCDARDGHHVDIHYFVKHIDYLFIDILDNKFLRKAKSVSKQMGKSLVKEFGKKSRFKNA